MMRHGLIALCMLVCSITSATAQVSVGIGLPGVSIGINLPLYPDLVRVPGYPVYYAPRMNSNYFFYDGMYWVYEGDNWYASSWYNGPWAVVAPEVVPLFVLRVPVRYYRQPPAYFHGWRSDAPPRWGEHWGGGWEQSHRGWDNWNRNAVPAPAPLPTYQRQYAGNRYPPVAQQQTLQSQHYRYQPRDAVVQQHYQVLRAQSAPAQAAPAAAAPGRQGVPRATSAQQGGQPADRQAEHPAPKTAAQRQQQAPKAQAQDRQPQAKEPRQAQSQQSSEAAVQGQQQAPKAQRQDRQAQSKAPAKEPKQAQAQQQPQAAVQREQAPKTQARDRQPQGKGPATEQKKAKDKDGEKAEQRGG